MPGRRQVNTGSSAKTVPIPTRMASDCARNRCIRALAASPEIATGLRPATPILSSADTASLRITCGRLSRIRRKCPAWSRAASDAPSPISTLRPAARSRAWPWPATSGLGSSIAETTRATPAARLRPSATDDDAVLDHDRANGGIGLGAPLPAPPERQRQLHESPIGGFRRFRLLELLPDLLFQDAEDHLRNVAIRASSSPESSPSTASKSFASRKF